MRRAVLLALLVVACSPDEAGVSTSTSGTMPSSTPTPSTTTAPVASTTTSPIPASTTTMAVTTTTLPVLPGNWADLPLIATPFGALGWWENGGWVWAEDVGALPIAGGEDYQVVIPGTPTVIVGGPQELVCDPLGNLGVSFSNERVLGEWPGPFGVAVSAPWEVRPRSLEAISDDGTYSAIARELLAAAGLPGAAPTMKQILRVDLEGDGVNEVLVVAEQVSSPFGEPGDYSLAFMRKVIRGEVQTAILGESVVAGEGDIVLAFTVSGAGDMNGDGKMEIVLTVAYYEGLGVEMWEYVDDDIGLVTQLSAGCGA